MKRRVASFLGTARPTGGGVACHKCGAVRRTARHEYGGCILRRGGI